MIFVLAFIGWILMYFGLCFLDGIYDKVDFDFWYIRPEKWMKNAIFYYFVVLIAVFVFL